VPIHSKVNDDWFLQSSTNLALDDFDDWAAAPTRPDKAKARQNDLTLVLRRSVEVAHRSAISLSGVLFWYGLSGIAGLLRHASSNLNLIGELLCERL
jgi:hypothetical protein